MSIPTRHPEHRSLKRRKLAHKEVDVDADISEEGSSSSEDSQTVGQSQRLKNSNQSDSKPRSNGTSSKSPTILPTGGINTSSVLGLQITELSKELKPNYDRLRAKWIDAVNNLESIIKQIPPRSPITAIEAQKSFRKKGISIPFPKPCPTKETNYKFEFTPPSQILISGALAKELSIKDDRSIDLKLVLPEALLQEKDYLNNRVFHKAAFYLACVALGIKDNASTDFDLAFAHGDGIDLLPILVLTPKNLICPNLRSRSHLAFPEQVNTTGEDFANQELFAAIANRRG